MLLHSSDRECDMKHFSLYCVPEEEARDLLEELHKFLSCTGQFGKCVDGSVSRQRVSSMYQSVEQVLREEMLTLCLREEIIWWNKQNLNKV